MIILEKETVKTNKYKKISGDDIGIFEIKDYSLIEKKDWILFKDKIIKKNLIIGIEIFSDDIFDFRKQDRFFYKFDVGYDYINYISVCYKN